VRTSSIIALMTEEAVRTSETSVNFNMTITRHYIPVDSKNHTAVRTVNLIDSIYVLIQQGKDSRNDDAGNRNDESVILILRIIFIGSQGQNQNDKIS
jgi:hypothetical protein